MSCPFLRAWRCNVHLTVGSNCSCWPTPCLLGDHLIFFRAPFFRCGHLRVAKKLRRVIGYVGEINLTEGEGTDTPGQLQALVKIPWRYGPTSAEEENRWMLARVQAFVSKSLFSTPAQVVKLGSCVYGFLEPINGASRSCQLVGWDVCSLEFWRSASNSTVPPSWEFNMDAIFCLPQLPGTNFGYARFPHVFFL